MWLFGKSAKPTAGVSASPQSETPAYPASDPGLPNTSVDDLLDSQRELCDRLKLALGSGREGFERQILPPLRKYAEYVHLIPATPDNFFAGPGGLLRLGIETALVALQAADGQIFSGRDTITKRKELEPRWRHATFIAGLCAELHRALGQVIVVDEKSAQWPAYLTPLSAWLKEGKRKRYYLRWIPAQEMRSLATFAVQHVIPANMLAELAGDNSTVVPYMLASITGATVYREANALDKLVRRASAEVIQRDLRASADRYGKPILGSHIERYLIDAMRQLVATNASWMVNQARSRVWLSKEGLFLVWPGAAQDVYKVLTDAQLPGIPQAPETILEILTAAGVVLPREASRPVVMIYPPGTEGIEAVQLSSTEILFAALPRAVTPLEAELLHPHRRAPDQRIAVTPIVAPTEPPAPPLLAVAKDDQPERVQELVRTPVAIQQSGALLEKLVSPRREGEPQARGPWGIKELPLRVHPTLRNALVAIVTSYNNDEHFAKDCSLPEGLFVPLSLLEGQGIDPAQAIRALSEAGVLAVAVTADSKTVVQNVSGEDLRGVVVKPEFVRGLDPVHFVVPAREMRHAAA